MAKVAAEVGSTANGYQLLARLAAAGVAARIVRTSWRFGFLALAACIAMSSPRREDVRTYVVQSRLPTAFRNCSPGAVAKKSETIYHVAACDQIAIYSCPVLATIDNPVCTLEAIEAAAVRRQRQADPPASVARALPTAAQLADADRLFEEGRALAKTNRNAEACLRFAKSDAIKHTFGTAVNLGDCAERDGHPDRAWQLYDDAARMAERDGAARRAQFARDRGAALAPRLCTVIVTIPSPTTPGLTIHIGGRNLPPAPEIRTLVQPGRVEIVVAAPGVPEQRRTLYGVPGAVVTVALP